MKKYSLLILVLVLTALLITGCRRKNTLPTTPSTMPTTMPTTTPTTAPTVPTTQATQPSTQATTEQETNASDSTVESGNNDNTRIMPRGF